VLCHGTGCRESGSRGYRGCRPSDPQATPWAGRLPLVRDGRKARRSRSSTSRLPRSIEGGSASVPGAGLLVGGAGAQHAHVVTNAADDLSTDGQPGGSKPAGYGSGRVTGEIERRGVGE